MQANAFTTLVCAALTVYYFILLARIIFSWLPSLPEGLRPIYEFTYSLTEPVFRLARPLIPPLRVGMMAIDLSALLVFFLLGFVRYIFC